MRVPARGSKPARPGRDALGGVGARRAAPGLRRRRGRSRSASSTRTGRRTCSRRRSRRPLARSRRAALNYGDGVVTTGAVWSRARALSADAGRLVGHARRSAPSRSSAARSPIGAVQHEGDRASAVGEGARRAASPAPGSPRSRSSGSRSARRPNARVPLGDWGYAVLLEQAVVTRRAAHRPPDVRLRPPRPPDAGARRAARRDRRSSSATPRQPRACRAQAGPDGRARRPARGGSPITPPKGPKRDPSRDRRTRRRASPPPAVREPARRTCRRSSPPTGYVFPVYGPSSFTNDFAASRADTGWHHGNDIFAPSARRPRGHRRHALPRRLERRSAGTASGYATARGTSSTTRTSPPSRRSRYDGVAGAARAT